MSWGGGGRDTVQSWARWRQVYVVLREQVPVTELITYHEAQGDPTLRVPRPVPFDTSFYFQDAVSPLLPFPYSLQKHHHRLRYENQP